ncbi:hypothetical protein N7501_005903 [Penicillium viridicatum]|nr:hypothetical protein N7501_005903 [Penicillium viridicatum]
MATILGSASPPESKLTLDKATIEDIPAIRSMGQVIRTRGILVLRDNEQIVGSVTFREDAQTTSLKIDNVVVNPTAQGRGYGYHMIKYAEVEAQKKGLSSVTLFTNVKMFENIGFYAKLGFWKRIEEWRMGLNVYISIRNFVSEDFLRLMNFISIWGRDLTQINQSYWWCPG